MTLTAARHAPPPRPLSRPSEAVVARRAPVRSRHSEVRVGYPPRRLSRHSEAGTPCPPLSFSRRSEAEAGCPPLSLSRHSEAGVGGRACLAEESRVELQRDPTTIAPRPIPVRLARSGRLGARAGRLGAAS